MSQANHKLYCGETIMNSENYSPSITTRVMVVYAGFVSVLCIVGLLFTNASFPATNLVSNGLFCLVLLVGLALLPAWIVRPKLLLPMLVLWWLPQVVIIEQKGFIDGQVLIGAIPWKPVAILSVGPNIGFGLSATNMVLITLNLVAVIALIFIFVTRARQNKNVLWYVGAAI